MSNEEFEMELIKISQGDSFSIQKCLNEYRRVKQHNNLMANLQKKEKDKIKEYEVKLKEIVEIISKTELQESAFSKPYSCTEFSFVQEILNIIDAKVEVMK